MAAQGVCRRGGDVRLLSERNAPGPHVQLPKEPANAKQNSSRVIADYQHDGLVRVASDAEPITLRRGGLTILQVASVRSTKGVELRLGPDCDDCHCRVRLCRPGTELRPVDARAFLDFFHQHCHRLARRPGKIARKNHDSIREFQFGRRHQSPRQKHQPTNPCCAANEFSQVMHIIILAISAEGRRRPRS